MKEYTSRPYKLRSLSDAVPRLLAVPLWRCVYMSVQNIAPELCPVSDLEMGYSHQPHSRISIIQARAVVF